MKIFTSTIAVLIFSVQIVSAQTYNFKNSSLPGTRVEDLLMQLTLEEKISLLGYRSKAVSRLGIPAYN